MKKLFLALFILIVGQKIYSVSMEQVKNLLYQNQMSLMSRQQYESFINPYLEEAYSNLAVVRYCIDHNSSLPILLSSLSSPNYISALIGCSVAMFRQMAFGETLAHELHSLSKRNADLRSIIEYYKETIDPTLSTQEEFDKTINLLTRVNEQYYASLGLMTKLLFWGQRQISRLFGNGN